MERDKSSKKIRAVNFKKEEKDLLIDIVLEHKAVVENKKTDNSTTKCKEEAWKQIASEYNSRSIIQREWKTLKLCYENMKKRAKQVNTTKGQLYKIGCGKYVPPSIYDSDQKIIAALTSQFLPIANEVINDIGFHSEVINTVKHTDIVNPDPACHPVILITEGEEFEEGESVISSAISSSDPGHSTSLPVKKKEDIREVFYKRRLECLEEEHAIKMKILKLELEMKMKESQKTKC